MRIFTSKHMLQQFAFLLFQLTISTLSILYLAPWAWIVPILGVFICLFLTINARRMDLSHEAFMRKHSRNSYNGQCSKEREM